MSNDSGVPLTSGPPETILPPGPPEAEEALARAVNLSGDERREAVARIVAGHPAFLAGWAELSMAARDPVEAYAYARVGSHRGLDTLRQAGWRGSGYVRWSQPTNRGFLSSLDALRASAAAIGEDDEAERCRTFLRDSSPAAASELEGF